jgi:hypothetical protein
MTSVYDGIILVFSPAKWSVRNWFDVLQPIFHRRDSGIRKLHRCPFCNARRTRCMLLSLLDTVHICQRNAPPGRRCPASTFSFLTSPSSTGMELALLFGAVLNGLSEYAAYKTARHSTLSMLGPAAIGSQSNLALLKIAEVVIVMFTILRPFRL